jgi:beta-galactosidase
VTLDGDPFAVGDKDNTARWWMEFLTPTTATVVARYKHPSWPAYAAMTRNAYGKGEVAYVGFMPTDAVIEKILAGEARRAGVEIPQARFPVIVRGGQLSNGRAVRYVLNYSAAPQRWTGDGAGTDLLSGRKLEAGQALDLPPWGVAIIEAAGR